MPDEQLKLETGANLELDSIFNTLLHDLHAELIGYTTGQGLIISHPQRDGIPVQTNPGERFIVCTKQSEEDICFEIEVVTTLNTPYPHIYTTYPSNIRPGSIRKSSRVPAAPADIQLIVDGDIDATNISILDVSCSGACLVAERQLGTVNGMFQINLQIEHGEPGVDFTCMIRYVYESAQDNKRRFSHGVFFIGMDAETQLLLWKYFQKSSATQYAEA